MAWFWLNSEGPDDVPLILSVHLVTRRKLDPDYVAALECVQRVDFVKQDTVILFRLFDPVEVPDGVWVTDHASLDDHPELIHYEGHIDPTHHWINVVSGTQRKRVQVEDVPGIGKTTLAKSIDYTAYPAKARVTPTPHPPRRRHLVARLFHRG